MRCVATTSHRCITVQRATAFVALPGLLLLLLAVACASSGTRPPQPATESTGSAATEPQPSSLAAAAPIAGAALPEGDAAWLAQVQQALAEREYRASENGEGLQAPNRRHNLRTYFEPSGIRVHDRTAAGSPALLGLSLVGVGRGETLAPLATGAVTSEGARVEIRHPGGLVEWYANSPAGLEQGFTLQERPSGEGALALELAVERASASLRGEQVILTTPAGRRLAYGKLAVVDATGAPVAAHLEVPDPARVRLVVTDVGAPYPLTIDPLLVGGADSVIESNQGDAFLGVSVAGAGNVNGDKYGDLDCDDVIVGAWAFNAGQNNEGAAWIFHGGSSGVVASTPADAATALQSNQADAQLGVSVAGAGDVDSDGYDDVVVGAYEFDASEEVIWPPGDRYVSMGEFRNMDVQVSSDPGFPPQLEAVDVDGDGFSETSCSGWLELYDDAWGWDHHVGDSDHRSRMFDYRDRHEEDWLVLEDYGDFNDRASAMRWNLPPGQRAFVSDPLSYVEGSGAVGNLDHESLWPPTWGGRPPGTTPSASCTSRPSRTPAGSILGT